MQISCQMAAGTVGLLDTLSFVATRVKEMSCSQVIQKKRITA